MEKLKKKARIKWRVLREKPRFVLGYVLDALFTWILGLAIAVVGMVLFPALAPSGSVSSVKLPPLSDILNVDKAGQIVSSVIEKMRQFSVSGFMDFLRNDVSTELRRLFTNLCGFVKRWREFLGEFVELLLSPRKIWEKLQAFWRRYRVKIKAVATQALGIAISFVLFKILLYFAPRISAGFLTIWGINAGFFILQWCIALVSPPIARNLRGMLGELWAAKKKRELHAVGGTFISNVREAMDVNRRMAETAGNRHIGGIGHEEESKDSGGGLGTTGSAASPDGCGGKATNG